MLSRFDFIKHHSLRIPKHVTMNSHQSTKINIQFLIPNSLGGFRSNFLIISIIPQKLEQGNLYEAQELKR